MYVFNKVTVKPQLPKKINRLGEIAQNLWWSWNTEFLRLFKMIDVDLWERVEKNPVKFLKLVSQEKLENAEKDTTFLKEYQRIVDNFDAYMNSKNTWFYKTYPDNRQDMIAYFSAEYGLDQILPIYSGGLGILSGDHLKSASDLGIPLVAVGLLYKDGYFTQKINGSGIQETEYKSLDVESLPINKVKDVDGEDLMVYIKFPKKGLYLKVWHIKVGRVNLYLMDSDIEENIPEYRNITKTLYGGNQETRIQQEMILGMAGVNVLKALGLHPTVYHMNEGHSSFLTLELMKNCIKEKKVSFEIAKEIVTSQTVFTTHTPVPAGNDIFPVELVEKYFKDYWTKLGITREEFLQLGANPKETDVKKFNMGILALRIAGKKNGVSKLHGAVSRELFAEVWPNIAPNESPITHVTNGIHTCSWLASEIKDLYNEYLMPYWQDNIHKEETWERIHNIPDEKLWEAHMVRKQKLLEVVKDSTTKRLRRSGYSYEEIHSIVGNLRPDVFTIGFARRFATYKRATLLFKDLERIMQIVNNANRPVQIIFAGKAHPADKEGQDLIKYIHEISMRPQFKGKIFLLENYSIAMSRFLISGVDVWLNNPRRPLEASGTSGQKASVNGVVNFSVLDGWWAEGYNMKNGWAIGMDDNYESKEIQDIADSNSMYDTLENRILPAYYDKDKTGLSCTWLKYMKESIISTGGKYSTARMLVDYVEKLYLPLCNLYNNHFAYLDQVTEFTAWKKEMVKSWNDIQIEQQQTPDNVNEVAGSDIEVRCQVKLPNIDKEYVEVQVYYGKIDDKGILDLVEVIPMKLEKAEEDTRIYHYVATIHLATGGEYGYTFRVMPKHPLLLDKENMNIIKWMAKG